MDKKAETPQGEGPRLVGSVTVVLLEGGQMAVNVVGGLSQLSALGLLAAGQQIVMNQAPKEVKRVIPVSGAPGLDKALRSVPGGKR